MSYGAKTIPLNLPAKSQDQLALLSLGPCGSGQPWAALENRELVGALQTPGFTFAEKTEYRERLILGLRA